MMKRKIFVRSGLKCLLNLGRSDLQLPQNFNLMINHKTKQIENLDVIYFSLIWFMPLLRKLLCTIFCQTEGNKVCMW